MPPVTQGILPLSAAELASARQYLYGGVAWGVLAELWMLAVLAWIYASGTSASWKRRLGRYWRPGWRVNGGVAALMGVYVLLALLPFDFYLGYARERAFGFENLGAGGWLTDWLLSSLITLSVTAVVVVVVYAWFHAKRGLRISWWLRLGLVLAVGTVVAVAVQPVLIAPLFNRFTPVENAALRGDIETLARRAGIPHARLLQVDASRQSSHTNAYVVGILGTQRIVVYDTLMQNQPADEIQFVVAHEIGHYVLDHLWKGVAFAIAVTLFLCALLGWLFPLFSRGHAPGDIAALPLLLVILLALLFLLSPLTNGFSRWEEHQADVYGLELSHQGCAAVRSFEREERTDLVYPDPPGWMVWWFFTHPSQQQRIATARRFCH